MKISLIKPVLLACGLSLTGLSGSLLGAEYLSDPEISSTEYWENYDEVVANYYDAFPAGWASEAEMQNHVDLNLIWLSTKVSKENKYVFPEIREKLEVAPYIKDWVAKGYKVKFWYDSLNSTDSQVIETIKLFESIEKSLNLDVSRLELVDIWTVKSVQNKKDFYTNKSKLVPIYLRADMIRLMISLDQIQNGTHYSVYSDLDVKAVPFSDLMDKDQQQLLKSIGMVVARGGAKLGMENAFHVVANQDKVAKALDLTLEANFARFNAKPDNLKKKSGQQVYDTYPPMFRLLYHLQGLGTLKFSNGQVFNLERDRQKAIKSFCLENRGDYHNFFTQINGSFTWNQDDSGVLKEMFRKDALKDEIRSLRRFRNSFAKKYLPDLEELEDIAEQIKKNKIEIKNLEDQQQVNNDSWDDNLSETEKNKLDKEYEDLESGISKLSKRNNQLKIQHDKFISYKMDLSTLTRIFRTVAQLRNPQNAFNISGMRIPKVTIDRPASKGSNYN